jgi:hypothetical protein
MADIDAFPTIERVLHNNGPTWSFTATTAVKRGQVVAIHATGVSGAVDPAVAASGAHSIGVAEYDAAAGAKVSVCLPGCICTVANADDTTGIDSGNRVESNDNAVGGTVSEVAEAAIAGAVGTNHLDVVGYALEDIAGGGTGKILVWPHAIAQLNNA